MSEIKVTSTFTIPFGRGRGGPGLLGLIALAMLSMALARFLTHSEDSEIEVQFRRSSRKGQLQNGIPPAPPGRPNGLPAPLPAETLTAPGSVNQSETEGTEADS